VLSDVDGWMAEAEDEESMDAKSKAAVYMRCEPS
jgi:hypothetical protein